MLFQRALCMAPALARHQIRRGLTLDTATTKVKDFINSDTTKRAVKASLVELTPPTPAEIPRAIVDGVKLFTRANWRHVTVREAWLNILVTTEVICWFFVGEVIGKGSLIGYQV